MKQQIIELKNKLLLVELPEGELWKDIPNWEGYYKVSSKGRVKSVGRVIHRKDGTKQTFKSRILKQSFSVNNGYFLIALNRIGNSTTRSVHSLMAESFIDKDYLEKKLCVNHIDGNKTNNIIQNLELVDKSYNSVHAFKMGLNKSQKLSDADVLRIRQTYNGKNSEELSIYFGITRDYVVSICNRRHRRFI